MQVTAVLDHCTQAVIGGHAIIEMSISSNAALMHMLSTALYTDQKLAVAREVLCNAWDAHIRAGIEDTAISVSITDQNLIIRDFGNGIAPDMMGPLYGTYGGTDKLNNGEETGGFGLGCKSPFSYNNHFEVISWHQGVKTVYNCSKSSADKLGKPGITPIVSLPTQETGIQVTIPLKSFQDKQTFIKLFGRIAYNGEMNVSINGDLAPGLPLSKAESNWIITLKKLTDTNHRIYVRYGNVVYPVEGHQSYASIYENLISMMNVLSTKWGKYKLVVQALPDTISVTPSRESLSMQEHTLDTLKGLLSDLFTGNFEKQIAEESHKLLDELILKAAEEKQIGQLMTDVKTIPGIDAYNKGDDRETITSMNEFAAQYVRQTYPKHKDFYLRDMALRIDTAITLGVGKRGHLNQVKYQIVTPAKKLGKKTLLSDGKTFYKKKVHAHEWFKKSVLRPLVRDMSNEPLLDFKRLSIKRDKRENYCEPMKAYKKYFSEYLPILRNILVLTYSKKDLDVRIRDNPDIKRMGGANEIWVYHVPAAKTRIQRTRGFFKAKGFHIIDLTIPEGEASDVPKVVKVKDPLKVVKPRAVGYVALSAARVAGKNTHYKNCFIEGSARVLKPEFYHKVSTSQSDYVSLTCGDFSVEASRTIIKLFGSVCAIVKTNAQAEKLKKEGLMELNQYVIDYMIKAVTTSPSFLAYWPQDLTRSMGSMSGCYTEDKLAALFDAPEVRKLIGLTESLNEHDRMVLSLWRSTLTMYVSKDSALAAAREVVAKMALDKSILDLSKKLIGNPFIDVLNFEHFEQITRQPNAKADGHLDRLAQLIKIALLG